MEIKQENTTKNGQFVALENGIQAGLMGYTWPNEKLMIIDHTEVNEQFRGKKVGEQLVIAAVETARKEQFKILPLCPFAKATFEKNTAFADVLH